MIKEYELKSLLRDIYEESAQYVSVGHEKLERNSVWDILSKNHIVKVYGDKKRWKRELIALKYFKNIDIKVPKLIEYGCINDDMPWILMSKLDGMVLLDLIQDKYDHNLYNDIGVFHAQFHEKSKIYNLELWKDFLPSDNNISTLLNSMKSENRKKAKKVISQNYIENEMFKKAYSYMGELESVVDDCNIISMCHNDFNDRNILVDESHDGLEIKGIIDFEGCLPGDPESDLAKALFQIYNTEQMESYLKGYAEIRELSKRYREKIQYYLLAFCFDICSWSFETANNYYQRAIDRMLKTMENKEMIK